MRLDYFFTILIYGGPLEQLIPIHAGRPNNLKKMYVPTIYWNLVKKVPDILEIILLYVVSKIKCILPKNVHGGNKVDTLFSPTIDLLF